MSDFDPYHKWLGIPPKDQPPHHYRLLGIELYESDPDVIDAAAEQRATFVRQCATGQYLAESQRLLNEIAAVRVCLLNIERKAAYDEELTATLNPPKATRPQLPTLKVTNRRSAIRPITRVNPESDEVTSLTRKRPIFWWGIFAGLATTVLLAVGLRGRISSVESAAVKNVANTAVDATKTDATLSLPVAASPSTIADVSPSAPNPPPADEGLLAVATHQPPDPQPLTPTEAKPNRPAREPVFLPIKELIADSGMAALGIDTATANDANEPTPAGLKLPSGKATQVTIANDTGEPTPAAAQGAVPVKSSGRIHCRGVRYVAVRGVIPKELQLQAYAEALEIVDVKKRLLYTGFVLERQAAVSGIAPWAGHWEKVNLLSSAEVLNEAAGFDEELAPPEAIDPAVTMDLPYRLIGNWGDHSTHPHVSLSESPVLLFRFLDFDVQPGMAYRYRAKLKIRNPNFQRPLEEVVDLSYTEGPERETDWSNTSNAQVIPNSVDYFLKDVERDPARDDKVRPAKAVASISMFEWDTKLGTMLSDSLRILSVGQFIAEKKKTIVVDAAAQSYKEAEEFAFNTGDVLLDAAGDFDLSPDQHPELGLKPDKWRPLAKLGLLSEAIVLNSLGELKQLDSATDKSKEQTLKKRVDDERAMFSHLKDAATKMGGTAAASLIRPIPRKKTLSSTTRTPKLTAATPASVANQPVQPPSKPVTTNSPTQQNRNEPRPPSYASTSTGMKFKLIPAGEFQMGSPPTESRRSENEGPQHKVVLSQPFYMGIYEVTQDEYMKVMGTNPASYTKERDRDIRKEALDTSRFPVESVSWGSAVDFCNKLSAKDGFQPYYTLTTNESGLVISAEIMNRSGDGYRLPTEAEWEYACRANTKTPFHFGYTTNASEASVNGRLPYGRTPIGKLHTMKPVGSYSPNVFGLYDMHGNVGEYCFDVYDPSAYQGRTGATVDPVNTAPKTPGQSLSRVVRGRASRLNDPIGARSAARHQWCDCVGFRVVCAGVKNP